MSHKNSNLPNDASARLFATLLGLGMAVMTIANMNEIEGLVLSRAEGLLGQTTTTTTRTTDTTDVAKSASSAATDAAEEPPTVAQTTSSARSVASSSRASTATIDERIESREDGVNPAADYSQTQEQNPEDIVIYKTCRGIRALDGTTSPGRYEHCGVDEAATQAARDAAQTQQQRCLNRNGVWTTDRTQCAPPLPPPPTVEDPTIIQRIEDLFIRDQKEQDRQLLVSALTTAKLRLDKLLSSTVYKFSDSDKKELMSNVISIKQTILRFNSKIAFTEHDLKIAREKLVAMLTRVQAMVTSQRRQLAEQTPRLENIVTRIDDLVTRVGTVLRELERDGLDVPPEVTEGYLTAKIYLTDAKRTCSMRRPASCALLGKALDEIAKMREPLCTLPSDRLTFCN